MRLLPTSITILILFNMFVPTLCYGKDLKLALIKAKGYESLDTLGIYSCRLEKLGQLDKKSIHCRNWILGKIPREQSYLKETTETERVLFTIAYSQWGAGFNDKSLSNEDRLELHLFWAANAWKILRLDAEIVQKIDEKDTRRWLLHSLIDSAELNHRFVKQLFSTANSSHTETNTHGYGSESGFEFDNYITNTIECYATN